ncbi:hypothetical protein [Acetobacter pasteurianus]|uniref:hypothetical protein n=1 Tax=Acetobacter pasteurianus TaxID=438 RepID=UPI00136268C7|nr:hypothetical protein [Acetobacter pasteurianus]QHM90393.1 hypothetical protein FCN51_02025 [Acetobacter pasteurianus]
MEKIVKPAECPCCQGPSKKDLVLRENNKAAVECTFCSHAGPSVNLSGYDLKTEDGQNDLLVAAVGKWNEDSAAWAYGSKRIMRLPEIPSPFEPPILRKALNAAA